jgi:hypothetical protein
MPSPHRFLLALLLGLPLAAALYFGAIWLQIGVPTRSSQWAFEINQRKAEIAGRIARPALFLVGGSATLFGDNAAVIEHETGVPTVNLGTHAALGPEYILHLARRVLRPGDTVLLSMEYELLDWSGTTRNAWADPLLLDYLLARDPAYFRGLPLQDQLRIALRLPLHRLKLGLKGCLITPEPGTPGIVYDAGLLDDRGDQTGHKEAIRIVNSPHILKPILPLVQGLSAHPSGMEDVRNFCRWATNNGVRVLATLAPLAENPAYAKPPAIEAEARVRRFYQELGVPLVGVQADWLYPVSEFYDTNYHLTEEGGRRHSKRLADRLRNWLVTGRQSVARE